MRPIHRIVLLGLIALAFQPAPADDLPPILTPQQREILRKSHLRLPQQSPIVLRTPDQQAVAALQDDVDVEHYFLDLEFIPASQSVTGSVTVTGKSLVAGFQHLVLDLMDNMVVTQVLRGTTNLAFTHSGNLVDITLDQPFSAGQTFDVKVTYNGVPDPTGFGSIGWRKYPFSSLGTMVWTLSEPDGAKTWWPCKDRPDDKATVEEWWTVPSNWTATGNGLLVGTVTKSGSRKQYQWRMHDPVTSYLVSIAATAFVKLSQTYTTLTGGTMPIDHYVYAESATKAQTSFQPLPSMITFYAQTWGEYPFVEDKYGMSEFPWSGGMEHSTNTSYGYQLIDGGHGYDYLMAHELSHQWWGDAVSRQTWKDVWLNEGFATYSEALWAEHLGGAANLQSYMNSLWSASFSGPVYNPLDLWGSTVYDKGGWVQHMLRHVVGDASFGNGMRDWLAAHDGGSASTAQYQATQEARYGQSLDWFFQEWVYGAGEPAYEYGSATADLGNGTFRTTVRIRQTQTDGTLFRMPIDLTLVTGTGNVVRTVVNDAADQDFVIDTPARPTEVRLDEKDWILKASRSSVTLSDADADGVPDRNDNCAASANPAQADFDGDGAGDACDPDDDNDGLADVSDCAPQDAAQGSPGIVDALDAQGDASGAAHLSWSVAARADVYDVQRSTLDELRGGTAGACIAPGVPGTSTVDATLPAAGDAYVYLVRGRDTGCGGSGSLGAGSDGSPRASACP